MDERERFAVNPDEALSSLYNALLSISIPSFIHEFVPVFLGRTLQWATAVAKDVLVRRVHD